MIVLPHVVGKVEGNQALDDGANHEADTSKVDLPSYRTEPAYTGGEHARRYDAASGRHTDNVAQKLLYVRWCKFGNPMILAASCRRPDRRVVSVMSKTKEMLLPHIDAISAILAYTNSNPSAMMMKPQKRRAVPPSVRMKVKSLRSVVSHDCGQCYCKPRVGVLTEVEPPSWP